MTQKILQIIGLILLSIYLFNCTTEKNKVDHLVTFAKVYGYVKYFHPSDEAYNIDWNKFAVYGCKKIKNCTEEDELIVTLTELFKPIAPSVVFSNNINFIDSSSVISEANKESRRLTHWQHQGVSFNVQTRNDNYKSIRINRGPTDTLLFASQIEGEQYHIEEITSGVFCKIPLTVPCNDESTFPKADSISLNTLKTNLQNCAVNIDSVDVRLANVIITYCVNKHFYPYFKLIVVDWEEELTRALDSSFSDSTAIDHWKTLSKFTATLKDGHIENQCECIDSYQPPVIIEKVENKFIVTGSHNSNVKVGEIVISIDDIPIEDYHKDYQQFISAGNESSLVHLTDFRFLRGKENSIIKIRTERNEYELIRELHPNFPYFITASKRESFKYISTDIAYVGLDKITWPELEDKLPELEKVKSIIFDVRNYPNNNDKILSHLLQSNTSQNWMKIHQREFPNQKNVISTYSIGWKIEKAQPFLGNKKIIFITDVEAKSYAESVLAFIEGYNIGTIVGQATAGYNGSVIQFDLLGNFKSKFTGMEVVKHDGSQHHLIGIQPDIVVNKTIKGVRENRDEFLEKAIELALLENVNK